MNEQWLLLTTPTERAAFLLGDPDNTPDDNLVHAARVLVNFPPNDDWVQDPTLGYRCILVGGRPGTPDRPLVITSEAERTDDAQYLDRTGDLAGITTSAIEAHRAARREPRRPPD